MPAKDLLGASCFGERGYLEISPHCMDGNVTEQAPLVVLAVGGSDTSSGAGVQADLKAISAQGAHAVTVVTAITAQSASSVDYLSPLPKRQLVEQLRTVFDSFDVAGVKCGLLPDVAAIETVSEFLSTYGEVGPVVIDPVMLSSSGRQFMDDRCKEALVEQILPLSSLITPNKHELEVLAQQSLTSSIEVENACQQLLIDLRCKAILAKGGHFDEAKGVDLLVTKDDCLRLEPKRVFDRAFHGAGCTYASAITTNIARGLELADAVRLSKEYMHEVMANTYQSGHDVGLLNHFPKSWR